jgi:hypothetical protein
MTPPKTAKPAKSALWFQLHSEIPGGLVRVNVHDHGRGEDVDLPLDAFTRAEREVLLDAFAIVATRAGTTPAAIAPVDP